MKNIYFDKKLVPLLVKLVTDLRPPTTRPFITKTHGHFVEPIGVEDLEEIRFKNLIAYLKFINENFQSFL